MVVSVYRSGMLLCQPLLCHVVVGCYQTTFYQTEPDARVIVVLVVVVILNLLTLRVCSLLLLVLGLVEVVVRFLGMLPFRILVVL